jgi:hypothetical protein
MKTILLACAVAILGTTLGFAQVTTWTNGAANSDWEDAGNWSSGVPTSTSDVQIQTQPTGNTINISGGAVEIASLTILDTPSTVPFDFNPLFGDTLQVSGNMTNQSTGAFIPTFNVGFLAGANSVWTGNFNFVNAAIQSYDVNIATAGIVFVSGGSLSFEIQSAATYGKFTGTAPNTVNGVTLNILLGAYTGQVGDSFDFLASGGFTGAILAPLPALDAGMDWDYSNFLSAGELSVVAIPEPATWALLAGGLGALPVFRLTRATRGKNFL